METTTSLNPVRASYEVADLLSSFGFAPTILNHAHNSAITVDVAGAGVEVLIGRGRQRVGFGPETRAVTTLVVANRRGLTDEQVELLLTV